MCKIKYLKYKTRFMYVQIQSDHILQLEIWAITTIHQLPNTEGLLSVWYYIKYFTHIIEFNPLNFVG